MANYNKLVMLAFACLEMGKPRYGVRRPQLRENGLEIGGILAGYDCHPLVSAEGGLEDELVLDKSTKRLFKPRFRDDCDACLF